jgi:NADH-quinone oxidoreductase subunit L
LSLLTLASESLSVKPVALSGAAENAWLVPLFPLIAFLVIVFLTRPSGKASAATAVTAMLASLGVSASIFLERIQTALPPQELSIPWISVNPLAPGISTLYVGIFVDNLAALMLAMVCFIALLIQIYSYSYITIEVGHFPNQNSASVSRFYAYLSLFVFSMLSLVLSNNLLQIYIFWELVGLCSYLLVGFWYFKTSAALASKKAFVVTKFADIGFLLGLLMLGHRAGTFNFYHLQTSGFAETMPAWMLATALILVFCGAIGKSAQFPLHVWLPDAMEGPTPVSALIHAATMVAAGVYLVARMFAIFALSPTASLTIAYLGAITAVVAGSIAIVQNDIKRVLAYSTVSQLGFMMAALGCGAMTAGTFHLITHAFFKALLFLGSGAIIVACHSNDMWHMGGLRKRLPQTHFAFVCGCLALAGCIPFAGFWSKDEILLGVSAHPVILLMLSFTAFLTAFYVTRMYCITFLGEYRGPAGCQLAGPVPPLALTKPLSPSRDGLGQFPQWSEERATEEGGHFPAECLGALAEGSAHHDEEHVDADHGPHEVSPLMTIPLLILAVFAVFLGFVGMPEELHGSNWFHHFIHSPAQATHEFSPGLMGGSIVIALAGMLAGWLLYAKDAVAGEARLQSALGRLLPILQQKLYMDHVWAFLLTRSVYRDAQRIGFLEEDIVDKLVYATGHQVYETGETFRREQSGLIQRYALQMALGAFFLVISLGVTEANFLWNPQGLLEMIRGIQP